MVSVCYSYHCFTDGGTNITTIVSAEALQALRILLPENLIIAAFDLIDRGRGLCIPIFSASLIRVIISSFQIPDFLGSRVL